MSCCIKVWLTEIHNHIITPAKTQTDVRAIQHVSLQLQLNGQGKMMHSLFNKVSLFVYNMRSQMKLITAIHL